MGLSTGCNHAALVTADLDRLIEFYTRVFDAEVVLDLAEGGPRHAMIDLGGGFRLHPFEFTDGNPHGTAFAATFGRGHIDHLALDVDDPEVFETLRTRLVEVGATDGEPTDFGAVRSVWFHDPDGMGCEIAMWTGGEPLEFTDRGRHPYTAVVR